ncbi:hypothetical protein JCM3770_000407 [Rhodotorula araucariae]
MEPPIPDQAAIVGSLWPDWSPSTFLEIQFLKIATEECFSIIIDDTNKKKHEHRFECGEEPDDGSEYCPCAWTIRTDLRNGETTTTEVEMRHNHALPHKDSPEARHIVEDNLATAADAAQDLEERAQEQFERYRAMAGYRAGYAQDCRELTPAARQEIVIWDLKVALGEKRARAFEKRMRKEQHTADEYPEMSTLDGRHPTEGPLELRMFAATARSPPPSSSSSLSISDDILVGYSLDTTDELPLPPLLRSPTPAPLAAGPSAPSFLRDTPVFADWAALEQATSAYAASQGFQVAMVEAGVADRFIAIGCTEDGCPWRVAVNATDGAEWEYDAQNSWFEHKHGASGAGGAGKQRSPGKGKGKGKAPVRSAKAGRSPKKKVKKQPSPPPAARTKHTRKCTLPPPILYSDSDGDEIIVANPKRPCRSLAEIRSPAPEFRVQPAPEATTSAATAVSPVAAAAHRAYSPASPADSDRSLTDTLSALDYQATSAAYAAAFTRGVRPAGPHELNSVQHAPQAALRERRSPSAVPFSAGTRPGTGAPTVTPAAGLSAHTAVAPAAGPSMQSVAIAPTTDDLERYLSSLDPTGAYDYLALAPFLRSYGLTTPAQLDRGIATCTGEMVSLLEQDGAPKILVRMFVRDVDASVQARTRAG